MNKKLLIPREKIQDRVNELGREISSDYDGREPILVGILNGVVFFFADLARQISIPITMDFIRASSYGAHMISSGNVRMSKDVEISIHGKPVILVEDIVDTGLTLTYVIEYIERKDPESIRICALVDKLERRDVTVRIDYCGFQIKEGFIVGYGLDYNEQYRHLPDIYVLR